MNTLNLKINTGISTIILSSLVLAACGRGSAVSYGPNSGTDPATTTTVNISAAPALIADGNTAAITWSSSNSTSCTSSPSLVNSTSGTLPTPMLNTTTTYKITCTGPTGSASKSVTVSVADSSTVANIAAAAQCLVLPALTGSGVPSTYYYCDCGTGRNDACVPGDDNNPGTDPLKPRRTIESVEQLLGSTASKVTVKLCKGGAFNPTKSLYIGSTGCLVNTVCNELADYTPKTFINGVEPTAKPIINDLVGDAHLINFSGDRGGVRILNLKLQGKNVPGATTPLDFSTGVFIYSKAHDVTMCNLDIDGFSIGVHEESGGPNDGLTKNITLTGSNITNSSNQGYLGGGTNTQINYNTWVGNGSHLTRTHAVYFSANAHQATNVQFIGNHVSGQYGDKCRGVVVVAHLNANGFRVENNTVEIQAEASTYGCYGISFDAAGSSPRTMLDTKISNNIIKNGGVGLNVAECPGCLIENNLIIHDWPSPYQTFGIWISADNVLTGNSMSSTNTVRNNTVWFGPRSNTGGVGITFGKLGTEHIVTNNAVYYSASTPGDGVHCFRHLNAPAAYTFINNNYCASAARFAWMERLVSGDSPTRVWQSYSLVDWRALAPGSNFDTNSNANTLPLATPVFTTDFRPAAGSPLIGKGALDLLHRSERDIVGTLRSGGAASAVPAIGAYQP